MRKQEMILVWYLHNENLIFQHNLELGVSPIIVTHSISSYLNMILCWLKGVYRFSLCKVFSPFLPNKKQTRTSLGGHMRRSDCYSYYHQCLGKSCEWCRMRFRQETDINGITCGWNRTPNVWHSDSSVF